MKKHVLFFGLFFFVSNLITNAQSCSSTIPIGTAPNGLTNLINRSKSIAVDKDLNTVVFIHRNNTSIFGGSTGSLRYDISTNGGSTWATELGILNPLLSSEARYPQVALYNPSGNTNPNNAYLAYMAATYNSTTWNGNVEGVRRLDGTGNTEHYNVPLATPTQNIPASMVKGAPGVFWAIDAVSNGTNITGLQVYKGSWNTATSDVQWIGNNLIVPPFNTSYDGNEHLADYHIAFDPSGQKGWISMLTHVNGGPSNYAYYPVFYATVNGGITWNGPFIADISDPTQFPCIAGNLDPSGTTVASTTFESDLTVDANGNPHLLTTILNGDNAYGVFFAAWHEMYDITVNTGTSNFVAYHIASLNSTRSNGLPSSSGTYNWDFRPMISRTADGSKIFYNWIDSDPFVVGWFAPNDYPNLYSKALDISSMTWTNVRNFTACNPAVDGTVYFPKIAAEVLQPSAGAYKMAGVYTILSNGDFLAPVDFNFLDNLTWNNSDFIMPTATATPSVIATASSAQVCDGAPVTLTAFGTATTYSWYSNTTTNIVNGVPFVPVSGGDTYTVTASNVYGCMASDAIFIGSLPSPTVGANASATSLCTGNSVTLTGSGASTYTWSGGVTNGISFVPMSTATYTVTGTNASGCTNTATTTVTVNSSPTVTATASASSLCAGGSVTLTGGGASTYTWSGGVTNGVSFVPTFSATYTVTGTSSAGCTNTATKTISVNTIPTVTATPSVSSLCAGNSVTLSGGGASTYTWSGGVTNGVSFVPTSTTTYTVTGTSTAGCTNTATTTVTVNTIPTVSANASASSLCAGTSVTLTGGGASTYIWSGGITNGVSFVPTATATYTVTGTNAAGCTNTATKTVTVNLLPTVTATPSASSLCLGTSATLTGGGASTYNWSGGITNGISFVPTSTATYTVTGTSAAGCTNTATTTITVNTNPTVTATPSVSSVCAGNSVTLSGGGASTYTWSGGVTNGTSFNPTATTTYTVTGTSAAGCTNTATTTVTVNTLPTVSASASVSSLCAGTSVTLTGGGASTYTWSGGVTNGVSFIPASTATYTVTGTDATGCTNTATKTVTVNPLPSVTGTTTDSVFCFNDAGVGFLALPSGGSWSGAGVSGNTFTPSLAGPGIHPAIYLYTDANGCSNTAIINMTVNALPIVTANATSTSICTGSSVMLSGGGASSYSWTSGVNDGVSFVPLSTNTYTVTGTDLNGCTNSASTAVTLNPAPTVMAQSGNQTVGVGTTVQMYVTSSLASATYQWQTNIGVGWQNLSNFGQYSGATNDTLTITNTTLGNNNQPFRCIISAGSCSDTSSDVLLIIDNNVGINELSDDKLFSVYPNPTKSNINVKVDKTLLGSVYTLYDNTGKTVLSGKINEEISNIELSNLSGGIYLFSIGNNVKRIVRIIKE